MATATAVRHGPRSGTLPAPAPPVYFVSDRPEAYEIWGEVSHDAARRIAALIAAHAGKRFPEIEFRVDGAWHSHPSSMGRVTEYIESHWQSWLAEASPAS